MIPRLCLHLSIRFIHGESLSRQKNDMLNHAQTFKWHIFDFKQMSERIIKTPFFSFESRWLALRKNESGCWKGS